MSMLSENMGEAVLPSGKKGMEVRLEIEEEMNTMSQLKDESSTEMVNWDKLLPQMVLRVLVVEADDSTRQIIAALLRKCSYRVAAVSDGLKAWETLKKKAPDIDLILTEVELPSISGFALLTLIKEHEICRNIPVIMMSSHDSINMAMKCILKGAADFLIKPVRRNVLSTLWQHVWRRHPKKLEAASENNAASNHSTGSVASTQKNNECCEKRSEAQSTCISPILEAESAYMQNMQDMSQPKSSSNLTNVDTVKHDESAKLEKRSIIYSSEAARCNSIINLTNSRLEQDNCAERDNRGESLRAEFNRDNPTVDTETHGCKNELVEPSRGAIDLIATFENTPKNVDENYSLADGGRDKFDFDPQLELSLRNFSGSSCEKEPEERQTLNHSDASAFSWYSGNKLPQPLFPVLPMSSAKAYSTVASYQHGGTNHAQENTIPLVLQQTGQVGVQLPNLHPASSPATGVTSDHMFSGYGNAVPSIFYRQSGAHPMWSPKSVGRKENSPFRATTSFLSNAESHNSEQHYQWSDASCASLDKKPGCDKSYLDPTMHDYPGTYQNTSISLCHDTPNRVNDGSYGSIGSTRDGDHTSAVVIEKTSESFSDNSYHDYDEYRGADSLRPTQREAALTKFRLKRKDRCYEKKVRYQSRKRLAEQRPRIKGQFVRQVQNDCPLVDSGGGS
ncbi:two-component response regulator-like APRR3 isoform X2 [Neltuma alba]|uniref:two-component response regulator-like APRR3 isoform X2 n=1 Tax=Neltuma alba TaxID=207710 RepID=UPI0010A530B0|nr:two-component response regulator-like APRR3 isoform X2 [Prosopis alba]